MSKHLSDGDKKITVTSLYRYKNQGEKISMLTAYDYTMAGLLDRAGIDAILVGDSAANIMAGEKTTLPITLEEMIIYGRNVVRAVKRAFVIVDMPFGSYQVSPEEAVANAVRIMKETGADAIKLEGGGSMVETIRRITEIGIPVVGHLGLTPQSVHQFGGFALRAKEEKEAMQLLIDSQRLAEEAGCCMIVLEKIPSALAQKVAQKLSIPIIGIGAGVDVDGQVLVLQDMLGMNDGFQPKFLRRFAEVGEAIQTGVARYISAVKANEFPNKEEAY